MYIYAVAANSALLHHDVRGSHVIYSGARMYFCMRPFGIVIHSCVTCREEEDLRNKKMQNPDAKGPAEDQALWLKQRGDHFYRYVASQH
jgi:hypothetical protein